MEIGSALTGVMYLSDTATTVRKGDLILTGLTVTPSKQYYQHG